jgi:hypothetical protein
MGCLRVLVRGSLRFPLDSTWQHVRRLLLAPSVHVSIAVSFKRSHGWMSWKAAQGRGEDMDMDIETYEPGSIRYGQKADRYIIERRPQGPLFAMNCVPEEEKT